MLLNAQPSLVLTIKSKPSSIYDTAFAVHEYGDPIYIVGYEKYLPEKNEGFCIEVRRKKK